MLLLNLDVLPFLVVFDYLERVGVGERMHEAMVNRKHPILKRLVCGILKKLFIQVDVTAFLGVNVTIMSLIVI